MLLLPFGNAFGFVRLHAAKPARQTNVSVSMPLGIAACYCRGPAMTTTRGGCLPTVLADSPARQNLACRLDSSKMRTFGGFKSGERFFYGEIRSEDVQVLAKPYWSDIVPTGEMYKLADVDVDVAVAPSKLIAVGLNYADHIAEMKRTPIGAPLIWFKAPSSLLPHRGTIEIAFSEHQTDFEIELAVVIGRTAKNIPAERASDFIFGYTVGLDISDRDLQKSEKQFGRCKSFDTYTPLGPFVYADADVADVPIELRQNGQTRQCGRTSQMIYSPAQIVAFVSEAMTLLPGDVILTGTPSGVGPLTAGDELEARIDDWPPLRNRVVNAR